MSQDPVEARPLGQQKMFLFALFMVAFNMRGAITGVGPITTAIQADTGLSHIMMGMLTTLPLVAFGLFSFVAPAVGRRFGFERVMLVSLMVMTGGILIRLIPAVWVLFVGSFLVGAGIAVLNVLVPALIRRDFHPHMGVFTGVYSALLGLTAGIAASIVVPLTHLFHGSWRASLAVWAIPGVVGVLLWAPFAVRFITRSASVLPGAHAPAKRASVWRSGLAWYITVFMGLQSLYFYTLAQWVPTILHERKVSDETTGYLMLLFQLVSVITSMGAPYLAQRTKDQVKLATCIGGVCVVGSLVLLIPGTAFVWLWVSIMGLGTGGCLSLALVLLGLRSKSAGTASELSGMTQAVGYLIAGLGPVVFGALHQWTNTWAVPVLALALTMGVMTWFARKAGEPRFVEQDLEPAAPGDVGQTSKS